MNLRVIYAIFLCFLIFSCKKSENVLFSGNKPPNYKEISTIKLENYVNRLFIDLLGREATNVERDSFTKRLRKADISMLEREKVILILQTDSTYHIGDSSYKHAYYQRMYDLSKARFMEGASDGEIAFNIGLLDFSITVARLEGDSVTVYASKNAQEQYRRVLRSKEQWRKAKAGFAEMCAAMLNNSIYDDINMGSFNYINATFDDLFRRKPSQQEFNLAYDIIDKNKSGQIMGTWASNKAEYCKAMTTCSEFYEAQIRWFYFVLLQREAKTEEIIRYAPGLIQSKDFQKVQREILKTDEYAQFY